MAVSMERVEALPVFPAITGRLIDLFDGPAPTVEKIVEVFSSDPALTSEVMKIANSALYAREKAVATLGEAAVWIGADEVLRIALQTTITKPAQAALEQAPTLRRVWRHSVAVAEISRGIGPQFYAIPAGAAEVAGLLHNIGALALMAERPFEYAEVVTEQPIGTRDFRREEAFAFGMDHCVAGVGILRGMGLPKGVVQAAYLHHAEGESKEPLVELVRAAGTFAERLGYGICGGGLGDAVDDPGLEELADLRDRIDRRVGMFDPPAAGGG